ncbi:MAG TPA: HAMP domain-containing sensor histidine kinase [Sphingomicrobium sp.]
MRTVLDQPARDPHDCAVRWRQLVDLLARAADLAQSPLASTALEMVRADATRVDEDSRAAAARSIAAFPLPTELISIFAADSLKVAAPVLAAAKISPDEWAPLLNETRDEVRAFILALHPDAERRGGLGRRDTDGTRSELATTPSISEVIARIEQVRESRERPENAPLAPSPEPHSEEPGEDERSSLFRWECTPVGEFAWVEGAPRGALIGRPLFSPSHLHDNGTDEIARAFSLRAPFQGAVMTLGEDSPLAGEWQVSGIPAFEHFSGRFAGYRGIARRTSNAGAHFEAPHPDTLRELVHEIKTPLNAIMGFAEIIHGQMFGPAERNYRERAGQIVAHSNLLLEAIDDLDFAAKLQSGAASAAGEANLATIVENVEPILNERAKKSGVELRMLVEPHLPLCAVEGALVERLLMRLVGSLVDVSAPGERLQLTASQRDEQCAISIDRPRSVQGLRESDLLDPAFTLPSVSDGTVSLGFSLRLVRGMAQLAGGDLVAAPRCLLLLFSPADLRPPIQRRYRRSAGQGL